MNRTFPFPIGTIHIIGIGGIGMSGYAEVLHRLGYSVQGSDQGDNANTQRLRDLGVRISVGHAPENIVDKDGRHAAVVVKSTAVKDDNPEIVAAVAEKIPVIARVDLLAEMMRSRWCVNVSGTHGKTTTTSMIGHVLEQASLDPTVINGGIINAYGSNARLGKSNWMVVESDESDGTFAHLPSVASIITNIDPEHLDYYETFEALKETFVSYIHNMPFYGVAIACIDHPVVAELLPEFHRKTITYGFSDKADIQAVNPQTTPEGLSYDVRVNDPHLTHFPREIKGVKLPMFGMHNILNSLTTFAIAHELRIAPEKVVAALSKFGGVKRRFTTTGIVGGITVIDDYGHHPVEIAAVLKAAREAVACRGKGGRVIAVVQPHRYTRLHNLMAEFSSCFGDADSIVVADVYTAGEKPIAGADKNTLAANIRKNGKESVHALDTPESLPALIRDIAQDGDFVVCLGAGSITQWAHSLPKALETLLGIAPKTANGSH